jgi:sulfofructose kinase
MSRRRLLGIGRPTLDRLLRVPGPPTFGAGQVVQSLGVDGGGPVATALVAARRLGLEAALATRLGTDDVSDQIAAGLAREGIDLSLVDRAAGTRSATSTILVDPQGERAILYDPGEQTEAGADDRLLAAVRAADGVLLDRALPVTLAVAREGQAAGAVVQLDAGGFDDRVLELIPRCDIVIASAYYAVARGLSPRASVDELLAAGPTVAIVTLGAEGAVGRTTGGEVVEVPAYRVEVVDTTGAGDVYHGAFVVAHLQGRSLGDAMRFAAVAAALKCRRPGGRAGIPDQAELARHLGLWTG